MKLLYLTSVLTLPNAKGELKIKEATDEDGVHIDFEALGIKAPKGKPAIDSEGNIHLMEDEIEYAGVEAILNLDEFSTAVDNEKLGSIVYTKDGSELWVFEEVEELSEYIEFLSLNSFEKAWIGLKIAFSNFFRRKNKTQKI